MARLHGFWFASWVVLGLLLTSLSVNAEEVEVDNAAVKKLESELATLKQELAEGTSAREQDKKTSLQLENDVKALTDEKYQIQKKYEETATKLETLTDGKNQLQKKYEETATKLEAALSEVEAWQKEATLLKGKSSDKEKQLIEQANQLKKELEAKEAELAEARELAGKSTLALSALLPPSVLTKLNETWTLMQPHVHSTWEAVKNYYAIAKMHIQAHWSEYKPVVDSYTADSSAYVTKHGGEVIKQAKEYINKVLNSKTVKDVTAQAKTVFTELESLAVSYLKQVPALEPLAQRPIITYILYAAFVLPILLVSLPVIALTRKVPQEPKPVPRRAGAEPGYAAVPATGVATKPKGAASTPQKKGKKIAVGKDSVRVP